ncbi:MAG: pyrroline-5-carboxylate reductase [Mycobacterium leprae]
MLQGKKIGFLGAGSIAESLMRGLVAQAVVEPQAVMVTNRANRERLDSLAKAYGVKGIPSKAELVPAADILVIACKPKDVAALLAEVAPYTRPGQILLSVAAGVATDVLARALGPDVQVVRAMPNTSCQVGESATAICAGPGCGPEALAICRTILGAVGRVVEVAEPLIDAVTGLSGSGPAYIYMLVEGMVEAGVSVGLPVEVARTLSVQTLMGAARMLLETGEEPEQLRQKVTSPGGTTMAGLSELQAAGFTQALVRAVTRATERSRELGALALRSASVAN